MRYLQWHGGGTVVMSTYDPLHHSRQAHKAIRIMFATRGRTCHICGHDGATEADLVIPRSVAPDQPIHPDAYRPAHGGGKRRCPTCGQACNPKRGSRPIGATWAPKVEW